MRCTMSHHVTPGKAPQRHLCRTIWAELKMALDTISVSRVSMTLVSRSILIHSTAFIVSKCPLAPGVIVSDCASGKAHRQRAVRSHQFPLQATYSGHRPGPMHCDA